MLKTHTIPDKWDCLQSTRYVYETEGASMPVCLVLFPKTECDDVYATYPASSGGLPFCPLSLQLSINQYFIQASGPPTGSPARIFPLPSPGARPPPASAPSTISLPSGPGGSSAPVTININGGQVSVG